MANTSSDPEKTVVLTERPISAAARLSVDLPVKPKSRYRFIRSIGFGGMKSVLLVYDNDTNREVAMAMMPDFRERPKRDIRRFVREARLTASLEHPNIVPVHDLGADLSGSPYFTMKYLRGLPLSTLLSRLRNHDPNTQAEFPLSRLLRIFQRVCNAIEFAHSRGYCHLDLKPGNINVGQFGDTFVIDWGLARMLDDNGNAIDDPDLPTSAGTPGYMAPEQINSKANLPLGVHSDIYSLGTILYSMLSLTSPANDFSKEMTLQHTVNGTFPSPSTVAPAGRYVPSSLEAVVRRAMTPDPQKRYRSVRELRQEILAYTSGFATTAEHASILKRIRLFVGRNFLLLIIAILTAALLVALSIIYFMLQNDLLD